MLKIKSNKKLFLTFMFFILIFYKYLINSELINEYIELELLSDSKYHPMSEQFLMYRCDSKIDTHNCGGLGDRFKAIMSAYLWSLLTNRTLLIKVNRPCNMASVLEPNQIDWNRNENFTYFETTELFKYGNDAFKYRLTSIDLRLLRQSKKLIVLHTNRNYAETIGKNQIYHRRLRELGLNPNKLDLPYTFRLFYNRLFKLSPNLESRYQQFKLKAKPNSQTQLFCAQIRIGGKKHEIRKNYYDILSQPVSNSKRYWKLIREKFISTLDKNTDYRVFITTDNSQVEADGMKEFGDKLVINPGPLNHIDYLKYSQNENDCSLIEKSILDFHSLQLCDMAVISRSQFGRMGLWNRIDPAKDVYAYNTDLDQFYKIKDIKEFRVT